MINIINIGFVHCILKTNQDQEKLHENNCKK
jgi:hypothetical protein